MLIFILLLVLLAFSFTFIVLTASPTDREQYKAYERWKERKKHERHDI